MKAPELLSTLWADGITTKLTQDGKGISVPAGRLTHEQRAMVLANKSDLIAFLAEAHATTQVLIDAAMRRCDEFGDREAARDEMRQQCLALPPHLQADLLQHFQGKQS